MFLGLRLNARCRRLSRRGILYTQPMDEAVMLWWAITLFVIAIIAAVLGFGGMATAFAGIAQVIFYIALALFVISLFAHLFRGGTSTRTA